MNYKALYASGALIFEERHRQEDKWGEQNHPDGTDAVFTELANLYRAATEEGAKDGSITYRDIFLEEVYEALAETDKSKLKAELVQVAAVASAWIEKLIREGVE